VARKKSYAGGRDSSLEKRPEKKSVIVRIEKKAKGHLVLLKNPREEKEKV